MYLIDVSKR